MVKTKIDLTGSTFGKLTVINQTEDYIAPNGLHYSKWMCKCACGNTKAIVGQSLKSGTTTSCGHCPNEYDLNGEYGICYMPDGSECFFDKEDFDQIKNFHWIKNTNGYAMTTIREGKRCTTILMHRLIMNIHDNMDIDHIHGNILDNRKSELRICYHIDNSKNQKKPKNNTSGYKGVSWCKNNKKWMAKIQCDGKYKYLGLFDTAECASRAYEKAAIELFGEYKRDYE